MVIISLFLITVEWPASDPDGAGTELPRVAAVFGAEKPRCAYFFANRRVSRMKVLVHDGAGICSTARRLNQRKFHWESSHRGMEVELDAEHLQELVLGLPWQRVGAGGCVHIALKVSF
jgi:transposase